MTPTVTQPGPTVSSAPSTPPPAVNTLPAFDAKDVSIYYTAAKATVQNVNVQIPARSAR